MANTVIQLKHSLVTDKPSALNIAEPAYSYSSNTFYIGSPSGTGSIAIGGKFYLDQQQVIYDRGNSAFAQSNSAASYANAAFAAANSASLSTGAYAQANAAFNTANAAFTVANNAVTSANGTIAWNTANAAFLSANAANATDTTQNNSITAAFNTANAAFTAANAATATDTTQNNSITAAFTRANNAVNANTGGTITADLVITGNLTVQGNTTYVNTQTLTTQDSLIRLANNNIVGDTVDIGFYGAYNSAGVKYTGLVRQAGANYFLFKGLDTDPTSNVLAAGSLTAANTGTLTAKTFTSSEPINYNSRNITTNVTITTTYNAYSAGPITINDGIVVTINDGAFWSVV
jgi:hypothetical protein